MTKKQIAKKLVSKKTSKKPVRKVLVLRTVNADMTSCNGFVYPESGAVSAPDWAPTIECGKGLHGLLWGEGHGGFLDWSRDAKWLVIEVDEDKIVDLTSIDNTMKCKFPGGEVVHCGDQKSATDYILSHGGAGRTVVGAFVTVGHSQVASAGYRGTASAGYRGTASAGNDGTASAGDGGTASAGYRGTASAGYRGTASAGDKGKASAGDDGTASAGNDGTASAGSYGTASAGDKGTASAGYRGTASAGNDGTASAGYRGTASAGNNGEIHIRYWDGNRYRTVVGYIGENGLEANVSYKLNNNHEFTKT